MSKQSILSWTTRIWLILFIASFAALIAWSSTVTTEAPPPRMSRTDSVTNRYGIPHDGLLRVTVTTTDMNDATVSVDPNLGGYLERVVFSSDGTDTSYKLYVKDALSVTLFEDVDCNMLNDPCSFVVTHADHAGTAYAAIPFTGGLNVQIADANDGDGNNVVVDLFVWEHWRR